VKFQDLRFDRTGMDNESGNPLTGWEYIGPGDEVEAMFMSGHQQD
jgi:hypothetical protein